ncbi:MAG: agmatine deiminase family protein, partial [Candidatus Cloacimonadota bacterium]|nr:agmatine deiminase family protein [Candidatus Cloacimonadota bacterium]
MRKKYLALLIFVVAVTISSEMIGETDTILSHRISKNEIELMKYYQSPIYRTYPPEAPVRPIAEFEPMTDVIVAYNYGFGIPVSLIADFSQEINVIIIIPILSYANTVWNLLDGYETNEENIEFMVASTDSYWCRDYGPWFVEYGTGNIGIVDFDYNRPRPNDDQIPQEFSNDYEYDYFSMNLTQTGGNYMADGMNVVAQSHIAYSENSGMSNEEVDEMMEEYLGASTYYVVDDPNGEYINHIDCWGKFLAPDKILIREVSQSHSQYDEIE